MRDPDLDERIRLHTAAAHARAQRLRDEARAMNDAGFHSAAFVWAVRAAEAFMRDFVLAPHFMELGDTRAVAMRKGSKVLGSSSWTKAFAKAEEWYGPFDSPRTEYDRDAWQAWKADYVRRRGELVHGMAVTEADADEANRAIQFADQMSQWYSIRLTFNTRHPIGRRFFTLFEKAKDDYRATGRYDGMEDPEPAG